MLIKTRNAGRALLAFQVGLLLLISTLKVADRELLAPLYDSVSRDLGLNDLQFGTIRSAADLTLVAGTLLFGLLADRWQRRRVVALGVLCWSAITWGTGQTRSFGQLLAARAGMHFFLAAFSVSAYPMLGDMVPRRSRGMVMGLLGATFALGTVVALVIAALLGTGQWRQPFIYFGLPGLILGLLVLAFLREPQRGAGEEEVMEAGGYAGRFTWAALGRTLRIRTALLIYLLDACQGATWWAFSFWAPAYLLRYGIAPDGDTAALALLPAILGFVVGTILGGRLIDLLRRRTDRSAVWVALISMTGALAMSLVVFSVRDLTAVLVAGFFLGAFGYLVMPCINVMLFDVVPPETRSSAVAADAMLLSAVSALTSLSIGAVSYSVGLRQGLAEGHLRAGFQGAVTVLLAVALAATVAILRFAPADMARLREHVARRAVSTPDSLAEPRLALE
jgi:MFS transporter, Spinster family, sphingosine-1-phosphate transporter